MTKIPDINSNNGRKGKYRENASKRTRSGTILQVKRDETRRPEVFTTIPGRFRKKKKNGAFGSTGRYKKQEKGHTFLKRGAIIDTKKQDKKSAPLTRTHQHQGSSRC